MLLKNIDGQEPISEPTEAGISGANRLPNSSLFKQFAESLGNPGDFNRQITVGQEVLNYLMAYPITGDVDVIQYWLGHLANKIIHVCPSWR